jgi:4-alpha-glucanotransferase
MSSNPLRSSGILLHPTSLPGRFGVGDLGPAAYGWIDQLVRARQTWWQILPLGPTAFGDSPYQSFSSFAGNLNLVSPEELVQDGLIHGDNLGGVQFPEGRADYLQANPLKVAILRRAWDNFRNGHASHLRDAFETFKFDKRDWLDDYAFFMAIKEARRGEPWYQWPPELLRRETGSAVLQFARDEMAEEIGFHQFGQFLFFKQWQMLRSYARQKGIKIIGDVPIFVAGDSADVWSNPRLYLLDGQMRPRVIAGVPPDYFSPTGQLWGNPLYDWDAHRESGFAWWIARLRATLEMVDLVRLDHFRGFSAAWHVPSGEPNAIRGQWVPGPGADLFTKMRSELGDLPLIAEDLGEITPDVYALRDNFRLPGMKVLQFAFDNPKNAFLPHHYTPNCVAYTGTHDNDTTFGWFQTLGDHSRWLLGRYTGGDGTDVAWDLTRLAWSSVAQTAIAPLQDLLDLGTDHRMNIPGTAQGNWQWRMLPGSFDDRRIQRLAELTELYARTA